MANWNFNFGLPDNSSVIALSAYTGSHTFDPSIADFYVPFSVLSYNNGLEFESDRDYIEILTPGNYLIDYKIRTSGSRLISCTVRNNDVPINSLTCSPTLATTFFDGTGIHNFIAGDRIAIVLSGASSATLINNVGACINIIKIN